MNKVVLGICEEQYQEMLKNNPKKDYSHDVEDWVIENFMDRMTKTLIEKKLYKWVNVQKGEISMGDNNIPIKLFNEIADWFNEKNAFKYESN